VRQQVIDRALRVLQGPGGQGLESAGAVGAATDRADELARQARESLPDLAGSVSPVATARRALAASLIDEGHAALKDIAARQRPTALTADQLSGLEAIIRLTGRPSLPVRGGSVDEVTPEWADPLALASKLIEQSIAGVGRLRVPEFADAYLGTAFLVAADRVMTNVHVAISFAERTGSGWKVGTGLSPLVDFLAEDGNPARSEFRVVAIDCLHPDPRLDLAVLRLERAGVRGEPLPLPLPLNGDPARVQPGGRIYVIGYPAADDRHDLSVVDAVFGRALSVKRLAPGEIIVRRDEGLEFTHDCSTLKGNSGSCVLDLATSQVVGLHRSGTAGVENRATSLAHTRQDALLRDLGITFSP